MEALFQVSVLSRVGAPIFHFTGMNRGGYHVHGVRVVDLHPVLELIYLLHGFSIMYSVTVNL